MKLWQAILLMSMFTALLVLMDSYSRDLSQTTLAIAYWGSLIWVANDVRKINIEKYKTALPDTPQKYFWSMIFFWYIVFPGYLGLKWRIKNGKQPLKNTNK